MRCTLNKMDGTSCGTAIKHCGGTTNLRNHLTAQHKSWYVEQVEQSISKQEPFALLKLGLWNCVQLRSGPLQKRHKSCRKLAYWLFGRKRAPHVVTDPKFHNFCPEILSGKFDS